MANPSVLDMARAALKQGGYDGLYHDGVCACLEDDLVPCGQINVECRAGYRCECADPDCELHRPGVKHWHIVEVKP